MNLPVYFIGLIVASLLAGLCLAAVLVYFDPSSAGLLVLILFYLSLFILSTSVFTLIGLFIRRVSQKQGTRLAKIQAIRHLEISFRQGLLLSLILITALILQSQRLLTWWYLLILVAIVALAEWWLARK